MEARSAASGARTPSVTAASISCRVGACCSRSSETCMNSWKALPGGQKRSEDLSSAGGSALEPWSRIPADPFRASLGSPFRWNSLRWRRPAAGGRPEKRAGSRRPCRSVACLASSTGMTWRARCRPPATLVLTAAIGFALARTGAAQSEEVPSCRTDYRIQARVDVPGHALQGEETILWRNESRDDVPDLWFHLYWNAFANDRSTFLREAGSRLEMRDKDRKSVV